MSLSVKSSSVRKSRPEDVNKAKFSFFLCGHFVAALQPRVIALFYSVITCHILHVLLPSDMVKWRNGEIRKALKTQYMIVDDY